MKKSKKNIRKVIEELKKELLRKGEYKTWLLFYKYVKVGIK